MNLRFWKDRDRSGSLAYIEALQQEFDSLHSSEKEIPSTESGEWAYIAPVGSDSQPATPEENSRLAALYSRIDHLGDGRNALCLSGGGIRSATFSLGVLQGLARKGWLEGFHYLSTVSGGGYIGSWLSSWIARAGRATVINELKQTHEAESVRTLRSYSNYLSPVWGLSGDSLTLIFTFLRNLLLQWTVYLPLLLCAALLPWANLALLKLQAGKTAPWTANISIGLLVVALAFIVWDVRWPKAKGSRNCFGFGFLCVALAAIGLSLSMWWAPLFGIQSASKWPLFAGPDGRLLYATLAVPLGLLALCAIGAVYVAVTRFRWLGSEGQREWEARAGGWWLALAILWIVMHGLVIYVPMGLYGLLHDVYLAPSGVFKTLLTPQSLGTGGVLSGLVATVFGYLSKSGAQRGAERKPSALALTGRRLLDVLSLAFIAILLLTLSFVGYRFLDTSPQQQGDFRKTEYVEQWRESQKYECPADNREECRQLIEKSRPPDGQLRLLGSLSDYKHTIGSIDTKAVGWLFLIAGIMGVLASLLVGANTFSLHALYGNRLCRAYLGASRRARNPHPFTGFDPDDNIEMRKLQPAEPRRLFHVVNIALNLAKATTNRLQWQQRKAASFSVSPLHSGSRILGYRKSGTYSGDISLARAFAISGAAASPNMGYHTSPLVAFVMAFFNVRLGWWLPNPGEPGRGRWHRKEPAWGLWPMLHEAFVRTSDEGKYVYLSDGGHFENLGLYEMILRRCRFIVVVDASCDPKYQFDELENVIRRVRVDMGVAIEFQNGLPGREKPSAHWVVGEIRYPALRKASTQDADQWVRGTLIYVKPVLSGAMPVDLVAYARKFSDQPNPFPHQSTTDQFFDEAQFESYRSLGAHSVADLPQATNLQSAEIKPFSSAPVFPAVNPPSAESRNETKENSRAAGWFSKAAIPGWLALLAALSFGATAIPDKGNVVVAANTPLLVVPNENEKESITIALFSEGDATKPLSRSTATLPEIARRIRSCAGGQRIWIQVRGYASGTQFKASKTSNKENLSLADKRTLLITTQLQEAFGVGKDDPMVEIEPIKFKTYEEMMRRRAYSDVDTVLDGSPSSVNRRVDMFLRTPVECSLWKIAREMTSAGS